MEKKKLVKAVIITLILLSAILVLISVLQNTHLQKLMQQEQAAIIAAMEEEADFLISNAGKPVAVMGQVPESCLEKSYPETFDLRNVDTNGDGIPENYVTGVKNQTPFGTCWSFASMAAAETSILFDKKQESVVYDENGKPEDAIDLSEHHLAWFLSTPLPQDHFQAGEGLISQKDGADINPSLRLSSGSTMFAAASMFASGMGPLQEPDFDTAVLPESQLNYHGKEKNIAFNEKKQSYAYSEEDDWSVDESQRFRQTYLLEEIYYLPGCVAFDENGKYDFDYADKAIKAYKEQLMNGRAVSIAFCADTYMPTKTEAAAQYINTDTWAHFCYEPVQSNHAVTIIGWDDNYPKENFLSEVTETDAEGKPIYDTDGNPVKKSVNRPERDGAWIVKNSWGALDSISAGLNKSNWGVDGSGYFYLSYYDQTLEMAECFDFDENDDLKGQLGQYVLEEYDYMPCEHPHYIFMDFPVSEANAFNAEKNEILKAVSCTTGVSGEEVEFSIYLIEDEENVEKSKRLLCEFSKTFENPGMHMVRLPQEFKVEKGSRITVCITQKAGDSYLVGMGKEFNKKAYDAGYCDDDYAGNAVVNRGESYIYLNESGVWVDFSEFKEILENADGATSYFTYDNFPIKIYASIVQ